MYVLINLKLIIGDKCQVTEPPKPICIVLHSCDWYQASHSLTFWGLCGWVVRSLLPHNKFYAIAINLVFKERLSLVIINKAYLVL
jgi:hypothetical protein